MTTKYIRTAAGRRFRVEVNVIGETADKYRAEMRTPRFDHDVYVMVTRQTDGSFESMVSGVMAGMPTYGEVATTGRNEPVYVDGIRSSTLEGGLALALQEYAGILSDPDLDLV